MRPRPEHILNYAEYPVLYVDDEPENLRIFELAFKRKFTVLTAQSGEAGLEVINSRPVAMVLSDHKMPGMSGTEFLAQAAALDPKTIRVLVTAYGDAKTLEEAINSGSIYKYVSKPWRPEEMRMTLRRGIEAYAVEREREQLVRELVLLNQVSKDLTQELAFEPLMALLLRTLTEDLEYDAACMLAFDAQSGVLSPTHFSDQHEETVEALRGLEFNTEDAPELIDALREGRVQRYAMADVDSCDAPVRRWLMETAADELLVVPLVGKRRLIGALAIDNRRGGRAFSADDQTLLEGLTHQAVIAIENARLVDDLRHAREQTRRADRLGSLGTLAAGLAHEINNPLVSIHTFLSLAPQKRDEHDDEFWGDYHALASREVDRIKRLVETMRSLGRDTSSAPREPLAIANIADEVTRLVAREVSRARVTLETDFDPAAPKLVAVRDHLHQVVLNLVLNALHATPPGGTVTLRTAAGPEGTVRIEVSDTGEGISEERLGRIFDPFFTTKDPSEGTGLGLMICHRIVEAHGGTIEVQSAVGRGTTFAVSLPVASDLGAPGEL